MERWNNKEISMKKMQEIKLNKQHILVHLSHWGGEKDPKAVTMTVEEAEYCFTKRLPIYH